MNSLLLTAHDYRTPRRANMHFIADELAKRGAMRFFSLRYSLLSRHKGDARSFLDERANRVETVAGVDCYLWKARVHPFNTRRAALKPLENALFRWTAAHPPAILERWMREADIIFFESGSAILHVDLAHRLNPAARKIYIASDDLGVINAAAFIKDEFERVASRFDALCLPSPKLAETMPRTGKLRFVPHGIDAAIGERDYSSPYGEGIHAVSVGSMLFDRTFFETAGAAFPEITFHVIGPGPVDRTGFPPNVRVYDEMAYGDTLRYIRHARFGIAPYASDDVPPYLADTSMKLMQYRFFSIPAVCPDVVTGGAPDRCGYRPGDAASIIAAVRRALITPHVAASPVLDWSAVTDRLIDPAAFPDTFLAQ